MKFIMFTDGGSRGNPGYSGIGVIILEESKKTICSLKEYIGIATNNQAEYRALIKGFVWLTEFAKEKGFSLSEISIEVRMDSELIVMQMNGKYKIKSPDLKILAQEVFSLTNRFGEIKFIHIPREKNQVADELVNQAIDKALNKKLE